ncbi:hypothetical protein GCM10011375_35210 [Hymenobacter qilianensis]|uniref:Uncharacterized protein n=2 Tax=Hymenobacter qilianensis TaxID=1385715 RepID=A0ACB5PVU5_9BACT|nr:DUF2490 domain-containing protein [Hymenobacter qilianensis]QNP51242.1 DUF2490 domain-containing protein [Hymenobacter qilianensis]GGF77106.1 hypothetical protein GCM10011375_35210 [Hymenobacter qilianensis]
MPSIYSFALKLAALLLLIGSVVPARSQSAERIIDRNTIGWFTYNGDHQIAPQWAVHTEVQLRRTRLGLGRQQLLSRLGIVYSLAERVTLSGGYTQLTTYPYGDYPTANLGEATPENRVYEDITLASTYGRLQLTHRFRLEQRWLGQLAESNPRRVEGWEYQNRARYQVAGELPLQGSSIDDGELYITFFDEIFIGFGENVGRNVFNQNRISGGLGYQIRDNWKLELSYLNQWTQHAEPAPNTQQSVFENNNGFRLNVVYNLDFTSSASAD